MRFRRRSRVHAGACGGCCAFGVGVEEFEEGVGAAGFPGIPALCVRVPGRLVVVPDSQVTFVVGAGGFVDGDGSHLACYVPELLDRRAPRVFGEVGVCVTSREANEDAYLVEGELTCPERLRDRR